MPDEPEGQFSLTRATLSTCAAQRQVLINLTSWLGVALSCVVPASTAISADLLNTFDGTSIDGNTWRQTNPQWISQNDALFFTTASNPGNPAQLTTTSLALA